MYCLNLQERAKSAEHAGRIEELLRATQNERFLATEVARLTRELARLNASWEKKFAILKQRCAILFPCTEALSFKEKFASSGLFQFNS